MEVDFHRNFRDAFGEDILDEQGERREIGRTMSNHLYSCSSLGGKPLSGEEKYLAYKLSKKIAGSTGATELSLEEGAFLKKLGAQVLSAGAYGELLDLIEHRG